MAIKTLNATVKHTTPIKGTTLSKSTPTLTIINALAPDVYDIYVDSTRGGDNLKMDNGYYIKPPVSLYKLFEEQYPNISQTSGDVYNLHIAENVAIVGQTKPSSILFPGEINSAGINLTTGAFDTLDLNIYNRPVDDGGGLFRLDYNHSSGDHKNIDDVYDIDFNKCYGKIRMHLWFLHSATHSARLVIYNKDGSINSDREVLPNTVKIFTEDITILKGQYAKLYIKYTPGNIDSKGNTFIRVKFFTVGGSINPAILISGKYFDNTHTVNIYNAGMVLGHGGDSNNYTPEFGSSNFWNKDIQHVYQDTHQRIRSGGDGISTTDVKVLNIYNSGIIAGGGGASYMLSTNTSIIRYTPGDGAAPYGRGGATWTEYRASTADGHVGPILNGADGKLLTAGSERAGDIGESSAYVSGYQTAPPGFYVRGTTSLINTYGDGEYLGLHPSMTTLPTR